MIEPQILLSIIIPAFNAENYIDRCLNRVLPILESDVECIVVNDGSTDSTLQMLKRISADISNIKVISQKNMGVSGARNNALLYAWGTYICYIDIDDTINTEMFRKVVDYLRNNRDEELIIFPHYEGNDKKGFSLKEQLLPNGKNLELDALYRSTLSQKLNEPWKKIYRSNILRDNDVKFPMNMYMGEDLCMFIDYLQVIGSYTYISLPYYYYYKNENSVTAKIKLSFIEQETKLYSYLYEFIGKYLSDEGLIAENDRLFLHKITRHIEGLVNQGVSKKDIQIAIDKSGAKERIKQIKCTNKVDLIRKWLLINKKYFILMVILKIFKGK